MEWYVLQVRTGRERDVCGELRRVGIQGRAPAERRMIRRRGAWREEELLLLPSYVFAGLDYTAAAYHRALAIPGVIRWLGMASGAPLPLDTADVLRWGLDSPATMLPSTVLFEGGQWCVVNGPLLRFAGEIVKMDRRQRRATVVTRLGGSEQTIHFGIISQEAPSDG